MSTGLIIDFTVDTMRMKKMDLLKLCRCPHIQITIDTCREFGCVYLLILRRGSVNLSKAEAEVFYSRSVLRSV